MGAQNDHIGLCKHKIDRLPAKITGMRVYSMEGTVVSAIGKALSLSNGIGYRSLPPVTGLM